MAAQVSARCVKSGSGEAGMAGLVSVRCGGLGSGAVGHISAWQASQSASGHVRACRGWAKRVVVRRGLAGMARLGLVSRGQAMRGASRRGSA